MNNTYYVIRHGQSTANVKHIIISNPKYAIRSYGLTAIGKQQVIDSIKANKELDSNTIIYSSDFKRARETAEIVRKQLKVKSIIFSRQLRERNFGIKDKSNDKYYGLKLWKEDIKGKSMPCVETVYSVANRLEKLISDLENKYKGKKILLATHGDPATIFLTIMKNKDPKFHHTLFEMKNAEIRKA